VEIVTAVTILGLLSSC